MSRAIIKTKNTLLRLIVFVVSLTSFYGLLPAQQVDAFLPQGSICYEITECEWSYEIQDRFGRQTLVLRGVNPDGVITDLPRDAESRTDNFQEFGDGEGDSRYIAVNPCEPDVGVARQGSGNDIGSVTLSGFDPGYFGEPGGTNPAEFIVECEDVVEQGNDRIIVSVEFSGLSDIPEDRIPGAVLVEIYDGTDIATDPITSGTTNDVSPVSVGGQDVATVSVDFEGSQLAGERQFTACLSELAQRFLAEKEEFCKAGVRGSSNPGTIQIDFSINATQYIETIDNPVVIEDSGTAGTSCEAQVGALGWVICPVTDTLLRWLDSLIVGGIVQNILTFELNNNQEDALRSVWAGFRTIANLGFVIAFFVVIYSAATGGVLSAYDVKRLMPRVLIGALAVQLSFFISYELIKIFNDLGNGVQELMLAPLDLAEEGIIASSSPLDVNIVEAAASTAVSIAIIIMVAVAAFFAISGILLMIVVFILRNMALMALLVLSPIAFVAWILPNTESLFKRWWSLYIQLLVLFPLAVIFISSGRLVGSIWASGGTIFDQVIGTLAAFITLFIAPELLSLAGKTVVAFNNVVTTTAQKARESSPGRRLEASGKAGVATSLNKRFGAGGMLGKTPVVGKAVRSTVIQRSLAQAQKAKRDIEAEDVAAAQLNLDATRAEARAGKVVRGKTGDAGEIAYLGNLLKKNSGATEEQKAAAVNRLLAVHGTDGVAVSAVNEFMMQLDADSKAGGRAGANAGRLRGKIIEDNKSYATEIPHLYKPNTKSTVQGLDQRELHGLKKGSVKHFMSDKSAGQELIDRTIKDASNTNTQGMIRMANVAEMWKAAYARGDAAQMKQIENAFNHDVSDPNNPTFSLK